MEVAMFQMTKQLFDQCWPAIAVQLQEGSDAGCSTVLAAPTPSHAAAAEAGYVLGVAIGYAHRVNLTARVQDPVSASIRDWRVDACGGLNWPQISSPRSPLSLAGSRR